MYCVHLKPTFFYMATHTTQAHMHTRTIIFIYMYATQTLKHSNLCLFVFTGAYVCIYLCTFFVSMYNYVHAY